MMTSEERAQNTFRSLATEAINEIMDALDTMGNFAPLHKNEMYGPEVDEAFKAIEEYVALTKAKYEPDKKRSRFVFKSEQAKRDALGFKPIVGKIVTVPADDPSLTWDAPKMGRTRYTGAVELFEDGKSIGVFATQKEIAELLGTSAKNVNAALLKGYTILGKYTVSKTERRTDERDIDSRNGSEELPDSGD